MSSTLVEPSTCSNNLTASGATVWAGGTRTLAFLHGIVGLADSPGAPEERWVVVSTEADVDKILFPANWANF